MSFKEILVKKGYTQASLARQLGITRQLVYRWGSGKAIPSTDLLMRLSVLFSMSAEEIYKSIVK